MVCRGPLRRARAALLATALAVVALSAPATAPAATAPSVPNGFFGQLVDGSVLTPTGIRAGEPAEMRSAGVRKIRVPFFWEGLEPAQGQFTFAQVDGVVADAARQGITVLPVVVYAPPWARTDPAEHASPPRTPALMQPVLRALVARYGPQGSLWREQPALPRRTIRSWQVWNEPDTTLYWQAPEYARSYTALLKASYRTLHRADRGVQVVAAGMTNASWLHLAAILRAGAGRSMDAAAVHTFSRRVPDVITLIRRGRRALDAAGRRTMPLLVTEFSWTSARQVPGQVPSGCLFGWETTEAGQAARIREVLPRLASVRRELRLEGVYWANWLSPATGICSFDFSGLRKLTAAGDVVDKPAYAAWRSAVRRLTR